MIMSRVTESNAKEYLFSAGAKVHRTYRRTDRNGVY